MIIVPTLPAKNPPAFSTAVDGGTASGNSNSTAISLSWTHTLTDPGAVVVAAYYLDEVSTAPEASVTCNGVAMTKLVDYPRWNTREGDRNMVFGLLNVSTGAKTITISGWHSPANSTFLYVSACSAAYTNVTAFGATYTTKHIASGGSLTVPGDTSSKLLIGTAVSQQPMTLAPNQRILANTHAYLKAAIADQPGGVNRTFTYTGTGSEVAGIAAIEIT